MFECESAECRRRVGAMRAEMRRLLQVAALPLVVGILPAPAHAWGEVGHTATCQIAFEELTERRARAGSPAYPSR